MRPTSGPRVSKCRDAAFGETPASVNTTIRFPSISNAAAASIVKANYPAPASPQVAKSDNPQRFLTIDAVFDAAYVIVDLWIAIIVRDDNTGRAIIQAAGRFCEPMKGEVATPEYLRRVG